MTRARPRALLLAVVLAGPFSPALAQLLPLPGPTPAAGVEPVTLITAQIENRSRRDKFLVNPTLGLRTETTAPQMRAVLDGIRQRLAADPRVEKETLRVHFLRLGEYTLDVEVFVYVLVADYVAYLEVQEQLLFLILEAIEAAGTGLAMPSQMTYPAGEGVRPRGPKGDEELEREAG